MRMRAGIAGTPIRDRRCIDGKVEQALPSVLSRACSMRLKAVGAPLQRARTTPGRCPGNAGAREDGEDGRD